MSPPPPPPPSTPPDRPWPPFPAKPRKSVAAPEQRQEQPPPQEPPPQKPEQRSEPEPRQEPQAPAPRTHVRPSRALPRDRTAAPIGDREMDAAKSAALADVMAYAARVTRAIALARPLESFPARPLWMALFAILSLAFGSYVYVARPDWVLGPTAARSVAQEQAHLRFAIYLAAQRVRATRDSTGALPATLLEIGEEWPGVEYESNGATFRLTAPDASGGTIAYESTEDLVAFVAGARRHLRDSTVAAAAMGVAP